MIEKVGLSCANAKRSCPNTMGFQTIFKKNQNTGKNNHLENNSRKYRKVTVPAQTIQKFTVVMPD